MTFLFVPRLLIALVLLGWMTTAAFGSSWEPWSPAPLPPQPITLDESFFIVDPMLPPSLQSPVAGPEGSIQELGPALLPELFVPTGPPSPSPDGFWSTLAPPERYAAAAVYDPVRDRMLVIGGAPPYGDGTAEVWALSRGGSPTWTNLSPGGSPPPGRTYHSAIYDPVRDRVIIFGGVARYAYPASHADVWSLSLSGTPTWEPITPPGPKPSIRARMAAAYDPVRDRMVIYGGSSSSNAPLGDAWALQLSGTASWTPLSPTNAGPGQRIAPSAVYDPARDRLIVVGGTYAGSFLADAWALSLGPSPTWSLISTGSGGPSGHYDQQLVLDTPSDRLLMFVGYDFPYVRGAPAAVWSMPLAPAPAWSHVAVAEAPPQRFGESVTFDPVRRELLMCWGWDHNATGYGGRSFPDAWALTVAGTPRWDDLSPSGSPPPSRLAHSAIYDPIGDRMVVFGGTSAESGQADAATDLWFLSLAGLPRWSRRIDAPGGVTRRTSHAAVLDSRRNRMIVFGGFGRDAVTGEMRYLNDVWALSLSDPPAWTSLTPPGSGPPARSHHSMIYDSRSDRVIVYAGRNADYRSRFDDVWALELAGSPRWVSLSPGGARPPGRYGHAAAYDSHRNRMLVFGGITSYTGNSGSNEAYALSLSGLPSWSSVAAAAPEGLPVGRLYHGAVYDPSRNRLIVTGGTIETYNYTRANDVWALTLQGPPSWDRLNPAGSGPLYKALAAVVLDPARDRLMLSGGNFNVPLYFDTWFLDFSTPSGAGEGAVAATSAGPGLSTHEGASAIRGLPRATIDRIEPNPSAGEHWVTFSLPHAGRVGLEMIDASGRRLVETEAGVLQAGAHRLRLDGGRDRPPGVYFVRLAHDGLLSTRKVAIIR